MEDRTTIPTLIRVVKSNNLHMQRNSSTHDQCSPFEADFYAAACHIAKRLALTAERRPSFYMLPCVRAREAFCIAGV